MVVALALQMKKDIKCLIDLTNEYVTINIVRKRRCS